MLHLTIITAAFYAFLFIVIKSSNLFSFLPYNARIDALSRIPSFVNVGVCIYSAYQVLNDFKEVFWDLEVAAGFIEVNTGSRDYYLHLCTGYMIYDLGLMMFTYKELGDVVMIFHHIVVISSLQIGVLYQAGTFYMVSLFFNEVSTIFVNLRFLLLHYKMGDTKWYYYNGVALAISFFFVRIVIITVLIIHVFCSWWFVAWGKGLWWSRPTSDRYLFIGLTLLLMAHGALNMFWFWKIVQHVQRASLRGDNKQEKLKKI